MVTVHEPARDSRYVPLLSGVSFFQPLRAGILDGFNPGALTAFLIYAVFLFALLKSGFRVRLRICGFLFGYWVFSVMIVFGFADLLLSWKNYNFFLDGAYLVIIVLCFTGGVVFFRDWLVTRRRKNQANPFIVIPFFSGKTNPAVLPAGPASGHWLRRMLAGLTGVIIVCISSVLLGGLAALISGAWPPEIYTANIINMLVQPGMAKTAGLSILTYMVFYVLPLLCLTVFFNWGRKRMSTVDQPVKYLSRVQIICSAVLLAYGISLTLYYL